MPVISNCKWLDQWVVYPIPPGQEAEMSVGDQVKIPDGRYTVVRFIDVRNHQYGGFQRDLHHPDWPEYEGV